MAFDDGNLAAHPGPAGTLPSGLAAVMGADGIKEQQFAEVSATCTGLITRIALSYEADPALRRELVQDILLAVWIALDNFRGEASLKTFTASIAQKRCISHVTRRAREPRQVELPTDLISAAPPPDEIALRNDQKKRLVEAIQLLPIPQREAIVLAIEGFSYAEMAEILGISTNAVMLRCQRAKTTLKSIMERRS
ncbi:sigma-70 family RNA polymerase sigma factor [Sphingomonas parva]|uniref:Sigma-70 family RNA polymerase sigma factor n=1 Tax=Sphingomonas parva TaxID=2555898 RepID=A0A4Y8ZTI9_9SPHN|nr:sigma-70 family RNA polymerase sigma factor [Sphingomonas parva]TFI59224.1 sigma-70 family RNA polymerase sigma factor [Sphingomonas parva]